MPRLRGASLAETLASVRTCSVPRALWIARQAAQALAAMHEAGWLHLDVKPANIMLDPSGHCTLIDLDLSQPSRQPAFFSSCDVRGTLAYTAPELYTSATSAQPASDVYSLGIVLYEALCGRLPFCCDSPGAFVEAHLRQIPPSARTFQLDLPVEVGRLVSRMLAKQPERRPSCDGELQDELARLEIGTFGMRAAA
jgi:serine/threonine-protein kinase